MKSRWILLAALLAVSSCKPRERGQYLDDLGATIQRSDQIVITEHSSGWDAIKDLPLGEGGHVESLIGDDVVYERRELSGAQKQMFFETVAGLDPKPRDAFTACVPEIHHTIRFLKAQKVISTMDICFQCGDIFWNGTKATPEPDALYSGLFDVMTRIGLHPERDWKALAREHLQLHPATRVLPADEALTRENE